MHHSDFIALLASLYKPNIYVELGLYEGETLTKVIPYVKKIYGIDLKSKPQLENIKNTNSKVSIQYITTNTFFETFKEGIDMIFIDADHCFESVLTDFENALKCLNPGGVIILHDTDPNDNLLINPGYCGDCYKIVNVLEKRNDINILTLPIESPGLSIITKKNNTRVHLRQFNQ
jgi:predicted O-methyltransferase YrrM